MNYNKIYYSIIENRKKNPYNGYTEKHHILPKSLGGNDNEENLVNLSAREHFICHLLLTKMYPVDSIEYNKMIKAFMMMLVCKSENQRRFLTSKNYQSFRERFSLAQKISQLGLNNSQFETFWITDGKQNKKIKTNEIIPDGWYKGRKLKELTIKEQRKNNKIKLKQQKLEIIKDNKKRIHEKRISEKLERKISLYKDYYEIYSEYGFDKFVEITGYKYSKQNLVQCFQKNLPEFVPQNGKKRGKYSRGAGK